MTATKSDQEQRKRRIDRVRKLLAVARAAGATEHEAANALALAQRQMEADGISEAELLAHAAAEAFTEKGAGVRVPAWEDRLAYAVGRIFACDAIHHGGAGRWSFVGIDPLPEIACYAFDVLRRQCLKARAEYIKTHLGRVTVRKNKVRRADLFTEGWIETAVSKAGPMARRAADTEAVKAYKVLTYPALTTLDAFDRNADRTLRDYEQRDRLRGRLSGADADLRVGVGVKGDAVAMIES